MASFFSLYKLSKSIYREALLHSQLEAAGSNQALYLERIGKNKNTISKQPIVLKFLSSFYILFLTVIPVRAMATINSILSDPSFTSSQVSEQWIILIGSVLISAFLLLEPFILIIFSIMMTWGLFSPEIYKWPQTLPLRKRDIEKLSLLTFIRGMNFQLLVMILIFPLGIGIGISLNKNLYSDAVIAGIVFISLLLSIVSAFFNVGVVAYISKKMSNLMEEQEKQSRKTVIIKMTITLLYLISSMTLMYLIQIAIEKIPDYFTSYLLTNDQSLLVNKVLSFIPFPFSGGYLITILITTHTLVIDPLLIVGSVVGLIVFSFLTYFLLKYSINTLLDTPKINGEKTKEEKVKKEVEAQKKEKRTIVEVSTTTPLKAFVKRDLTLISKDLQLIMIFIMPIIIPIFAVIIDTGENVMLNNYGLTAAFISVIFYIALTSYMVITGITNIESGGETIISSIPIRVRDQVKSKLPYFFSTIPIAFLGWHLFFIKNEFFAKMLSFGLAYLFAIPLAGIAGFFFKISLFGKLRYKYVVEEIKTENRVLKHILSFIVVLLVLILFMGLSFLGYIALLGGELLFSLILLGIFNYMFPK